LLGSYDIIDFQTNATSFPILVANTPLNIFMSGHFAVCAFFVISGYVLTYSYNKTNDLKLLQLASVKRYIRLIIPVVVTCLIVFILFRLQAFQKTDLHSSNENLWFERALFKNDLSFFQTLKMAFFNVPFSADNTYLPILWTMQVEFLGVLLLFAFLMLTHKFQNKWVFGLIIFIFCFKNHYAALLFAGSLICIYEEKIKIVFRTRFSKLILLLAFLFFSGLSNVPNEARKYTMYGILNNFNVNFHDLFHKTGVIFLLLLLVTSHPAKKLLSLKPLVQLGKLSFSIYLIHLPILYLVGNYIIKANEGHIAVFVIFISCFVPAILLSIPFYLYIDKFSVTISNKFSKRIKTSEEN
jgi:peptidoglycan/LPS O-acetylase OafA/YrhL